MSSRYINPHTSPHCSYTTVETSTHRYDFVSGEPIEEVKSMTETNSDDLPDWWIESKRTKEELGLPEYQPPRFLDEVYVHDVIPTLEDEYNVAIRFQGINTQYPDDWTVSVDSNPLFSVGRRRDCKGNTVYQLTSSQFKERFSEELSNKKER